MKEISSLPLAVQKFPLTLEKPDVACAALNAPDCTIKYHLSLACLKNYHISYVNGLKGKSKFGSTFGHLLHFKFIF